MIIYALPLLIAGMAGIVNETMDRILLKFLLPSDISMSQLGIYSACYKISIIITIFIQAFRFAADPFFFSQSQNKDAKEIYASVMNYFIIICLAIFLIIMMYIDIVKFFIGKNYFEGLIVVPILLMANVFLGVFYNLSIWYKLSGKTIYGAYLAIFGAIITLILNYLWIPVWGYIGAAWATLICYFFMMIASYIIGQKHYKINYNLKKSVFYFLLTMGLFFGSLVCEPYFLKYKLIANSLFLIVFFYFVVITEKKKFLKNVL
jgi:O-antigen/teichoic acid export membrane protein